LERGKAERLIANIANIWDCFRTTNVRNILKARDGLEDIPCQKLASPIRFLFESWIVSWITPGCPVDRWVLDIINHCQILEEIGLINDEWETWMVEKVCEDWVINNEEAWGDMLVLTCQGNESSTMGGL
jgi:hypothetical protein